MKKITPFGGFILALVIGACTPANSTYYAAPSGHYTDGLPKEAQVVVSTSVDRIYKYEGCVITQYYTAGVWKTAKVEC